MPTRRYSLLVLLLLIAAAFAAPTVGVNWYLPLSGAALLGLGIVGTIIIFRTRRRLRQNRAELMRLAQMCVHCGDNIRAPTDRCPEFGQPIGK